MSTRETPFNPLESLTSDFSFVFGRSLYDDGFYWEAHEIWESVWMACAPNSPEKLLVQALIQSANGRLKTRMGRPRAAEKLFLQAQGLACEAFQRAGGTIDGVTYNWFDAIHTSPNDAL